MFSLVKPGSRQLLPRLLHLSILWFYLLLQVLLITRFLQHEHHHGRLINQVRFRSSVLLTSLGNCRQAQSDYAIVACSWAPWALLDRNQFPNHVPKLIHWLFLCTQKKKTLLTICGTSNCGGGGDGLLVKMFLVLSAHKHTRVYIHNCMVISLFVHVPCFYIHLSNHNVHTKIYGVRDCSHGQWPCCYHIGTASACTAHWTIVCGYPVCVHMYSFCIRPVPIGRILYSHSLGNG